MVTLSSYFLTIASVSAVLAGICVTLRNFAYSTLIDPNSTGLTVGERDYTEILKLSGFWATITSVVYLLNTAICMIGLAIVNQSTLNLGDFPAVLAVIVGLLFLTGIVILTITTLRGFFQTHQPDSEERAPTEPIDEDG